MRCSCSVSRSNVWVEECAGVCLPVSAAPLMIKSHSGMGHFAIKYSVGAEGVTLQLHRDGSTWGHINLSQSDLLGYLTSLMQAMSMFGRLLRIVAHECRCYIL